MKILASSYFDPNLGQWVISGPPIPPTNQINQGKVNIPEPSVVLGLCLTVGICLFQNKLKRCK